MGISILPAQEKKVKESVASLKAKREKTINPKKKKTKKKTGGRTKSNQETADISRLYDILKGVINPKYLKKETAMKANKGGKVSRKK